MVIERAGFRADIQGLRAVAVLLVVVYHAGLPMTGGYVGVDVFFVISGFLITNHLLYEIESTGRLDFPRFYARRARRILPASFAVVVATLIGAVILMPPALLASVMKDAIATALYVPNLIFAWRNTDYLADQSPSPYQHYWSLGVEEQFYLAWPLVLLVAFLLARRSKRMLTGIVAALVIGSFLFGLFLTFRSQPWAFFSLPSRAWELGIGALIAVAGPKLVRSLPGWLAASGGWLGVLAIAVSGVFFDQSTAFPGYTALLPVLGAAAVIFFGQRTSNAGPGLMLSSRPFQFIGAISYSLYLVHWPLLVIPSYVDGKEVELPLAATVTLAVLGIPLAWLLYRFVENPLRRSKRLSESRPRFTLWLTAGASAMIVAVSAGVIFADAHRPTDAGKAADETVALSDPPQFTPFVPSNLEPSLDSVGADIPAIYGDGCHANFEDVAVQSCVYGDVDSATSIALFGDSHAAQWFPPLEQIATQQGLQLHVFTKSSCPAVMAPIVERGVPYIECDTWRDGVIERLVELDPELVVLGNYAHYVGVTDQAWSEGLAATLEALPSPTRTLVLSDTPSFSESPSTCISANLNSADACASPVAEAVNHDRAAVEETVAERLGAGFVSFNNFLCDSESCGPIIGSTLVYRDAHHLTTTQARLFAPELWNCIATVLDRE